MGSNPAFLSLSWANVIRVAIGAWGIAHHRRSLPFTTVASGRLSRYPLSEHFVSDVPKASALGERRFWRALDTLVPRLVRAINGEVGICEIHQLPHNL